MAQNIAEYLAKNYSLCEVDNSFIGSWQGLAYTSHLIQLIAIPIQILTFYLIIKKSPSNMKCVKGPLLVSHFWYSVLDFTYGTLSTPYIFFPECALFGVGILDILQVPMLLSVMLIVFSCFAAGLSMIYLFEVRSSSIQMNTFKITKRSTKLVYYIANYSLSFLFVGLILFKFPESQETAKLEVLKSLPCPTREFFTQPTFVILSDSFWSHFITMYLVPALMADVGIQCLFYVGCCVYYLFIFPSKTTSWATRRLQSVFFIGIVIQTGVPVFVIAISYSILIISCVQDNMSQGIMNMCMVIIGVHGIVESITIIMVHGSYRRIVFSFFKSECAAKKIHSNIGHI